MVLFNRLEEPVGTRRATAIWPDGQIRELASLPPAMQRRSIACVVMRHRSAILSLMPIGASHYSGTSLKAIFPGVFPGKIPGSESR
jgi:hypothetical protein